MNSMIKKCVTCKQIKNLNEYYKSAREKDGVEYQCKNCSSVRQKNQRESNWKKILKFYGEKCFCCAETVEEFLTIDHIGGGGSSHRKLLNRGRLYAFLVRENFPSAYRLACMNCNFAIGMYGSCPHTYNHPKRNVL